MMCAYCKVRALATFLHLISQDIVHTLSLRPLNPSQRHKKIKKSSLKTPNRLIGENKRVKRKEKSERQKQKYTKITNTDIWHSTKEKVGSLPNHLTVKPTSWETTATHYLASHSMNN